MQYDGVWSHGDHNQIFNHSEIGQGSNIVNNPPYETSTGRPGRWDFGIITVISPETKAVLELFGQAGRCKEQALDGRPFYEARLKVGDNLINIAVTQSLGRGQRQAGGAYFHLRKWYAPRVTALVGIAGGIHPDVRLGDVVIGTRIVYYDSRREDPGETRFRGESHDLPPAIQHSVNAFFSRYGEPAEMRRQERRRTVTFRAMPGHIGSGEAVIRDESYQARRWLHTYNDKILATETEGAALAHGFHEDRDADAPPRGWVVIRGISDNADPRKDDAYHVAASRNAVHAFSNLLPYLLH